MKGDREDVEVGDVVQLDPNGEVWCAGCFMLVTDVRSWGVVGFVSVLQDKTTKPGRAFYRANWEAFEVIGPAAWVTEEET